MQFDPRMFVDLATLHIRKVHVKNKTANVNFKSDLYLFLFLSPSSPNKILNSKSSTNQKPNPLIHFPLNQTRT